MINNILAFGGTPGGWEWVVIIFVGLMVYGIPIILVILFLKLFLRNRSENIRLRLEVGKLADELEKKRKQAKGTEEENPSDKSG